MARSCGSPLGVEVLARAIGDPLAGVAGDESVAVSKAVRLSAVGGGQAVPFPDVQPEVSDGVAAL
ncbi:hypothetical protein GCM10023169_17430 [Georgenia halophila]|uniref:Uncharacterized protein n=1 Tax=Georgenia halophila TaxID=620889 RepID=A0ABP8L6K1_9MICO